MEPRGGRGRGRRPLLPHALLGGLQHRHRPGRARQAVQTRTPCSTCSTRTPARARSRATRSRRRPSSGRGGGPAVRAPPCWSTPARRTCSRPWGGARRSSQAAEFREPHRVAPAPRGAGQCVPSLVRRVPRDPQGDGEVKRTHRLWLNDAVRQVLANGLDLLRVSAPRADVIRCPSRA
ncbi:DALR anticodon-binding domain-containing protein [Kocuria rhizophila]|nr:DALR anticodon-binding domain-containing protein [Kocuria rhizophila]